jgi:hypothetical protein
VDRSLRARRGMLERSWRAGVEDHRHLATVRPDVYASWVRSSSSVAPAVDHAPVEAPEEVEARWRTSALGQASRVILDDLTDLAGSDDLVAALTDDSVTIAWMSGGRTMMQRAAQVHFTLGGRWAEDAVGTNALAVAERTGRPATIFSAEHYAPMVHDWVCYSAPILDPASGRFLGVIDLSTVWDQAHPSYLTTARALARCVECELGRLQGDGVARRRAGSGEGPGGFAPSPLAAAAESFPGLVLRTLGAAAVVVDGAVLPVTPRQVELLAVLSLHPGGLTLDELSGRVYGDRHVSPSTVKAELSHLRQILGGRIGSRPYRLIGPVLADHLEVLDALGRGLVAEAVSWYGGSLLASSESPDLQAWRHHIDVAIRDAVLRAGGAEELLRLSERCADDAVVHQAALAALAPSDLRRSMVAGRLAAAAR